MPVVDVEIRAVNSGAQPITLVAMIDSGADGTIVPLVQLRALKARRIGQVTMRGITSARTLVDIYEVTLQIGPHHFPYVRVAADRQNGIMVLGRDGPATMTEIRD